MKLHLFTSAFLLSLAITATSPAREIDLAVYMPKDTDLIMSLNVRQIFDSPLGKKHAEPLINSALAGNKGLREAIAALGLDPLKHFQRASIGIGLEDLNSPKGIAVIEGTFDTMKIATLMDELIKKDAKQFSMEKVGGKAVFKIATPDQPFPIYAAAIDANLFVLGTTKEFIGTAFEAAQGMRKPTIRKELAELLAKADAKASLYAVALTKDRLGGIPVPEAEMRRTIEKIHAVAIDIRVEKEVDLTMTLFSDGVEMTKALKELVVSGIDLLKVQLRIALPDEPELQPLVGFAKSIRIEQKGATVVLTGSMSADAIEKWLTPIKK